MISDNNYSVICSWTEGVHSIVHSQHGVLTKGRQLAEINCHALKHSIENQPSFTQAPNRETDRGFGWQPENRCPVQQPEHQ